MHETLPAYSRLAYLHDRDQDRAGSAADDWLREMTGSDPGDDPLTRVRLARGQVLYRAGDEFRRLYVIRFGWVKSTYFLSNARTQITGFAMRGDLLGLDGLATGVHACDATALEDSEVIAFPFNEKDDRGNRPWLVDLARRAMSQELARSHAMQLMLSGQTAEQRTAAFLVSLSRRMAKRGYSRSEFVLRMSRAEIGSFLGLALETVSRCMSNLARRGLIEVDQKRVLIADPDKLEEVAQT